MSCPTNKKTGSDRIEVIKNILIKETKQVIL